MTILTKLDDFLSCVSYTVQWSLDNKNVFSVNQLIIQTQHLTDSNIFMASGIRREHILKNLLL